MTTASSVAGRGWMEREGRFLDVCLASVVLVAAFAPMARLLWGSLVRAGVPDLSAALENLTSRAALTATLNTIDVGVLSAFGATVLGAIVALALAATDIRAKRAIAVLFVGSLLVAPQVMALAFKTMMGPSSLLLDLLGLAPSPGMPNPMLGKWGIIAVLTLHHAPLAAVALAGGLRAIPQSLIDAAHIDGASPWRTMKSVVLPLLRPHFIAAGLLTFVAGAGNFGIPALLGVQANYLTLPTLIYRQLSSFGPSVLPDVAGLSVLAGGVAASGILLAARLRARTPSTVQIEHRFSPFWPLAQWRPLVEAAVLVLIVVAVVLPALSLIATAVVPALGVKLTFDTVTLAKFREVLTVQDITARAFRNSFLFAGVAAVIVALLGMLIAYALERRVQRGKAVATLLIQLPYAVPGVVLSIACILLLLRPLPLLGVSLYGTGWIILFAYVARFLAVALEPIRAAMALLERDQEEAAALCGASLTERLRYIIVPALLPSMAAAALLVFLMAFNELTVSALLWSAGTETLGVALLSLEDAGLGGEAAAVAVLTALFVALIIAGLDRLAPRLPEGALPWVMLAGGRTMDSSARS